MLPGRLCDGIGGALLGRLIETAGASRPAIVLSVRESNPARRLYERYGFETVARITNRVDGNFAGHEARLWRGEIVAGEVECTKT